MAKVLVTGANGFIGSHLVCELLNRGHEVQCLVRATSDLNALSGLPVTIYVGDLIQPETLSAPVRGVEYISHCGAQLMATCREDFEAANLRGTVHLLEAAAAHCRNTLRRFLYVSSQAAAGPGTNATPLNETSTPQPI